MIATDVSSLLLFLPVLVTGCLLIGGIQYLRLQLRRRFGTVEDNLRTYNTANAAIGRHVMALENELAELRKRVQKLEAGAHAHRGFSAAATVDEFSEAEMRLAERLKAGLGLLRLG